MTINQAIYDVLDGVGISTDDFPVHKRFVYSKLKDARNDLIKQELNKNRLMDGNSAQVLQCFKLERVDAAECPEISSGVYILRSVLTIPEIIESDAGPALIDAHFKNGVTISFKSRWKAELRNKRRYKLPDLSLLYLKNGRVYVSDFEDVDELEIDIAGYFSNPEEVSKLNAESDTECDDGCKPVFEYEFECPSHIRHRVIEITKEVVRRKLGIPEDVNNNAKFDPNVPSTP